MITRGRVDALMKELHSVREELLTVSRELDKITEGEVAALETEDAAYMVTHAEADLQILLERYEPLLGVWKAVQMWHNCEWTETIVRKHLEGWRYERREQCR